VTQTEKFMGAAIKPIQEIATAVSEQTTFEFPIELYIF
jgi:hypothetical protein